MPVDKNIFFLRPGDDMELRLANQKSSDSALRNAAGFEHEEYKMFKDVIKETVRKHLDLSNEIADQDKERWQMFVNELWGTEVKYIMENYEKQWPMMVYVHKHLAHTSRRRRRKRKKVEKAERRDSNVEIPGRALGDIFEDGMSDNADAIYVSSSLVSNDAVGASSLDTKVATRLVEESAPVRGALAKAKENVPPEEGHRVESEQSSAARTSRRSRRRWTPVVEIPVRRTARKSSRFASSSPGIQPTEEAQVDEELVHWKPAPLAPPAVTSAPVKEFLQSCYPSLEEFLPVFIDAGIVDESSLMMLVLSPPKDRLSFLKDNFIDKMTLEQMLSFNEDCELQSWYSA